MYMFLLIFRLVYKVTAFIMAFPTLSSLSFFLSHPLLCLNFLIPVFLVLLIVLLCLFEVVPLAPLPPTFVSTWF